MQFLIKSLVQNFQ